MKTLTKEHSQAKWLQGPPGVFSLDTNAEFGAWRLLNPNTFVSSTYFDLAGLAMEDKTLFFEGATVQNWLAPLITNVTGSGDHIVLIDIMTSSPLSDATLLNLPVDGNFAQGDFTFDQTIYGRIRQYVVDVDTQAWGSMVLGSENQIGSLEATASDRVYSYSLINFGSPFSGDTLYLSPCRHLLRAEAREEKEYQYLMRLKRSYELQQEPDVDKA